MNNRTLQIPSLILAGVLCFSAGWFFGKYKRPIPARQAVSTTGSGSDKMAKEHSARDTTIKPENGTPVTDDISAIDFSLPAAALLQQANEIEGVGRRRIFLRRLVNYWIEKDPNLSVELREKLLAGMAPDAPDPSFGFSVELSHYVSMLSDAAIREEWKQNFANHPARSEIYTRFLTEDLLYQNPQALFENSRGWNPWERNRYNKKLIHKWAAEAPNEAFAWYQSHAGDFDSTAEQGILDTWAEQNFNELSAHWQSLPESESKHKALEALAKQMAFNGTDQALDWANSLPDSTDQDLAHEVIFRETPRGIGAVLITSEGFPEVREPLVDNGLQPGDLIVSAMNDGVQSELFGANLGNVVEVLRGEPGSDVTLQVLRRDPATGEYHQTEIAITRQQLWMEND